MSAGARATNAFRVYIGNLPWTVSKRELMNYLIKFGPVKDCNVVFNKNTGMSRGYGFAVFRNRQGLEAVTSQPVHHLEGSKLQITANRPQGVPKDALKYVSDTDGNIMT